jgi:hypothetical protein
MSATRIDCPYRIHLPRKTKADKKVTMNMNNYRNWHYQINNQVKHQIKRKLQEQFGLLLGKRKIKQIYVHYVFHPFDKRGYDTMNIASVISKFFLDALTEYGTIKDDNYKIVVFESCETGRLFRLPVCCVYLSESPIYGADKRVGRERL